MAFTNINGEDRLVQQTFADHLERVLGWDSVYAYFGLTVPGTAGLRRHHRASSPGFVQVAPEVRDPQVVAVGDRVFLLLVPRLGFQEMTAWAAPAMGH